MNVTPTAVPQGVCGECGAPHHDDQRYCLSCGGPLADPGAATVPFAPVSGATVFASPSGLSERLLASSPPSSSPPHGSSPHPLAGSPPSSSPPDESSSHPFAGSPPSSPPAHLLAGSPSHRPTHQGDGSASTVIAGVGVLLLAMGVGILIGRTGNSAPAATGAPQVVTVSAPATGTNSSESESSESTSGSNRKGRAGKHHGNSGGSSSKGVGSSIDKPAPPSVVTNLHKSGGGSYEQKSKELPNVISTG